MTDFAILCTLETEKYAFLCSLMSKNLTFSCMFHFFIVPLQRFLNHEALFLYTFLQYIAMATSLRPANYYTVITLHLWWLTARSAILSKTVKLSIVFLPPIGFCSNNHFSNWRRHLCQFFYSVISIRQRSLVGSDDQRLSYCVTNVVAVLPPLPTD